MARKYRQKGYMDYEHEKRTEKPPPTQPVMGEGPKTPRMPGTRTVARCAACGTILPVALETFDQCPKCGVELHACKQCASFDPGSRFECAQPIPERIPDKTARNDCAYFELSTRVEREASTVASMSPEGARRAFENLFKK